MKLKTLLLMICLIYPFSSLAEQTKNELTVYTKKSRLTVENLNKTTEILRDPTQASGSFRDALKRIKPSSQQQSPSKQYTLPDLSLNALVAGPNRTYSAMLKIDKKVVLVKTGYRLSIVSKKQLYEVVINKITREEIRLTLLPANEQIILR